MSEAGRRVPDLIPVRMLNEFVYCPRLAYLEWADGEFLDNAYTLNGKGVHRRVDARRGTLAEPEAGEDGPKVGASVTLSSERLGIVSKLDLVESSGKTATPIDYKRGKRPHVEGGVHDPERVQLCAQGLLLREHGYECPGGLIYFAGSRERVPVPFDDELIAKTLDAIRGLRERAALPEPPPPLEDSPKCPRCSLLPICLPDEVGWLQGARKRPRPLSPARETGWPLYVTGFGGWVRKKAQLLEVEIPDEPARKVRLAEISQLVVVGPVNVSTGTIAELAARNIPITYLSSGGWFLAHTVGTGHHNVLVRIAQHRAAARSGRVLRVGRALVAAKIANQRTLLRRNGRGLDGSVLVAMKGLRDRARRAEGPGELLGIEGAAAAAYFGAFPKLLKTPSPETARFDFEGRNRRPPRDPVNCMLSLAYAMLVRHWTVALSAVGVDPYLGFYHQPRFARPSLALDLMEPYRPLLADSAVITAVNNVEVCGDDFIGGPEGVALTKDGRRRFISTFERCLDREFTHPVFGYRISYRRSMEVDARLFGRYLLGEFRKVPVWTTR
jgi:CRISP-associated protein Cas1